VEKAGNLSMSIAFDLVQLKNGPVAVGKRLQRARERNAIEGTPEPIIMPTEFTLRERNGILVTRVIQRDLMGRLPSKMHEGCGHSDTMQPSGKSRFSTKRGEFSEHLYEGILGQIIGLGSVFRHAKDYCVDPVFVQVKQRGERVPIAIQGSSHKTKI
jgi:hypothetical protein